MMASAIDHFENVDRLLKLMSSDAHSADVSGMRTQALDFERSLEALRSQASIVHRLFERFQTSDQATRIYVQRQIDTEFEALSEAYRQVTALFLKGA